MQNVAISQWYCTLNACTMPREKKVLDALFAESWIKSGKPFCQVSIPTLQKLTGIRSEDTVRRAKNGLLQLGIIQVVKPWGNGEATIYFVKSEPTDQPHQFIEEAPSNLNTEEAQESLEELDHKEKVVKATLFNRWFDFILQGKTPTIPEFKKRQLEFIEEIWPQQFANENVTELHDKVINRRWNPWKQ